MTVTESRLSKGTLKLGTPGTDFSSQLTACKVTPSANSTGDEVEVLSGDILGAETTTAYVLAFTAIQDFTDPDGIVAYSWDHDLTDVAFEWSPIGTTGPKYAGTVSVRAIESGGEVGVRLSSDTEWPILGKPTVTYPAPGAAGDDLA